MSPQAQYRAGLRLETAMLAEEEAWRRYRRARMSVLEACERRGDHCTTASSVRFLARRKAVYLATRDAAAYARGPFIR